MADPPGVRQEFMLFTSASADSAAAVGSLSSLKIHSVVVEVVGSGRIQKWADNRDCRVQEC